MPAFALLFFILKQTTLWILCRPFIFSGLLKSAQPRRPVGARLLMLARGWLSLLAGSDATCLRVAPARFVLLGPDGGNKGLLSQGRFLGVRKHRGRFLGVRKHQFPPDSLPLCTPAKASLQHQPLCSLLWRPWGTGL